MNYLLLIKKQIAMINNEIHVLKNQCQLMYKLIHDLRTKFLTKVPIQYFIQ